MKSRSRTIGIFLIFVFVVGPVSALAQEQPGNPAHNWLNGKWEGPAPSGGTMEMTLRLINGNQTPAQARFGAPVREGLPS